MYYVGCRGSLEEREGEAVRYEDKRERARGGIVCTIIPVLPCIEARRRARRRKEDTQTKTNGRVNVREYADLARVYYRWLAASSCVALSPVVR